MLHHLIFTCLEFQLNFQYCESWKEDSIAWVGRKLYCRAWSRILSGPAHYNSITHTTCCGRCWPPVRESKVTANGAGSICKGIDLFFLTAWSFLCTGPRIPECCMLVFRFKVLSAFFCYPPLFCSCWISFWTLSDSVLGGALQILPKNWN
jgi:hypothetical protein